MPNLSPAIAPTLNHVTTRYSYWGMHGFAVFLIFAIFLQAFVSPGLRVLPRAHFHLSATHPHEHVAGAAVHNVDSEHHHPHPHRHASIATHEHGGERADVVYVDAHEHEPPSGQAPNRFVLDHDGLLLQHSPSSTETADRVLFRELALSFRTLTEPPLERPPRVVT